MTTEGIHAWLDKSALTELVIGRTRDTLKMLRAADVEAAVGELSNESKHAAVLCIDAVKKLAATSS